MVGKLPLWKLRGGARAPWAPPWIRPWRSPDAGLMLAQPLRRWTNINQTLVQIIPTAVSVARLFVIFNTFLSDRLYLVTLHYFWLPCKFYQFAGSLFSIIQLLTHITGMPSCSEYVLWELPSSATTMPFGISSRTNNERLWKCTNEW